MIFPSHLMVSVLLTTFLITIQVLATPLAIPGETNVDSTSTKHFTGKFHVQPPTELDANVYHRLENGTSVVISATDEPMANYVDCDTTDGSPKVWDILEGARRLEELGARLCIQTNPGGSHCTTSMSVGTAQIAVCGKFWHYVPCDTLGWAARQIVAVCRWKDYAGGKYIWNGDFKAIVY
ncbi:hypothetical protein HOY82DRAFT_535739 [Tuber indicum]|nr:hypothetical protein HOY82DRAFT_535739 [Tuber indicum]